MKKPSAEQVEKVARAMHKLWTRGRPFTLTQQARIAIRTWERLRAGGGKARGK